MRTLKDKRMEAIRRYSVESHSHSRMLETSVNTHTHTHTLHDRGCVCVCAGASWDKQENNLLQSGKLVLVHRYPLLSESQAASSQQPTGDFVHLSHPISMKRHKRAHEARVNENHSAGFSSTGKTFRIRPESFAHNKVIVLTFK